MELAPNAATESELVQRPLIKHMDTPPSQLVTSMPATVVAQPPMMYNPQMPVQAPLMPVQVHAQSLRGAACPAAPVAVPVAQPNMLAALSMPAPQIIHSYHAVPGHSTFRN